MNYKTYTVEAFVLDQKFRKWVLEPDPETASFWENWLQENPRQSETVQQARQLLLSIPDIRHLYEQKREDKLWDRITEEVRKPPTTKSKVVSIRKEADWEAVRSKSRRPVLTIGRVAASVLILLSLGITYFLVDKEATVTSEPKPWVVKQNPYGQRSTIFLSDGTEVVLNAGSQLEYYPQFSPNERRVRLTGEAFFTVARDTLRPFRVITGNLITQALGTSFNVKAFPDEAIQVALVTGKVSVSDTSDQEKSVILQPGESAEYNRVEPGGLNTTPFNERLVLSWKDGTLYFEEADEPMVFTALERWYGVKIKALNTSPEPWEYTGEIKDLSLDQLLLSLSYTMHFEYTIDNNQVTITYHE